MSERILRALMQLFAIIAKVDDPTEEGSHTVSAARGRLIVESFLKQQLTTELVEEYLLVFDQFMQEIHKQSESSTKKRKKTSVNSVKLLLICTQINGELTQKQKVVVLVRLIEFIYAIGEVTDQELDFVSTVASTFNIEEEEFIRCMAFASKKENNAIQDSPFLLQIDNKETSELTRGKHLYSETIAGEIHVLSIHSVGMYLLRYYGTAELYLNGAPLGADRVYVLTQGSSIRSSKVNPIYYSDIISCFLSDTSISKISFVAKDLQFKFKGGKFGLHTLNFAEESGKLIGIMGGSGAGKSTLLNILNGIDTPSSGEVLINGFNLHKQKKNLEGVIGFVSQDDLLIEELTVFQNLFYNAKLCFDGYSDEQITKIVHDLLNSLGLYETKDLKVGSPLEKTISGGQRKRLNIGLELIREPAVMFVDEPTSGLSSRDSENIMDLLKELALKGKLVFVVIHQPSSEIFKMFDKLAILDLGGYPIYFGNPVEAVVYFKHIVEHVNPDESECPVCGNVNPEQIFNIIESKVVDEYGNPTRSRKVSPKEWNEHYHKKTDFANTDNIQKTEIPKSTFKIPNKINQFKVFIKRDILSKLTNTQYLSINLLEAPVLAFILAYLMKFYNTDISNKVGYIYRENDNVPTYMFMSVVVALFIGLTVSAEEIIRDRKILKREAFLNLSKGSYIFSKISIMFMLSAIQTFTFIIVGNTLLDIKGMYVDYWFVLFTTSCFANMLGLNISASFNSAVTIYIMIPFLIIPQLLLSGIVVKFEKLNPTITSQTSVPEIGDAMTSRWAFEALAVNQFKKNEYEKSFYEFDKEMSVADYRKNYWIKKLNTTIDKCESEFKDPKLAKDLEADLKMIQHEISLELENNSAVPFTALAGLKPGVFNEDVANSTRIYLNLLNKSYTKRWNKASDAKDKIISKQSKTEEQKAAFRQLKDDYSNESLDDLLRNAAELEKILDVDNMLIQRSDPVFKDGDKHSFIRAHFYAPTKNVFGNQIDTFWVNLGVIWLMSIFLAVSLYFEWLKKCIDGLGNLSSMLMKKKTY